MIYASPRECQHLNLTYDGTFAIVRCMDCDATWDADQPIPRARRAPATTAKRIDAITATTNTATVAAADLTDEAWQAMKDIADMTKHILNPDNEPTSEHMQHKDKEDDNN